MQIWLNIIDDSEDRVFEIFPIGQFLLSISFIILGLFLFVIGDKIRGHDGLSTNFVEGFRNKKIREDYLPYGCLKIIIYCFIVFFLFLFIDWLL